MGSIITTAGLNLLASAVASGSNISINRMIYANISGLDHTATPPVSTTMPTAAQIVYNDTSLTAGYLNSDTIVYSSKLGTTIGDFTFNWIGLVSSTGVLIAVAYLPSQTKLAGTLNQSGNFLSKNFGIQYTNIKDLAGITVVIDANAVDPSLLLLKTGVKTINGQSIVGNGDIPITAWTPSIATSDEKTTISRWGKIDFGTFVTPAINSTIVADFDGWLCGEMAAANYGYCLISVNGTTVTGVGSESGQRCRGSYTIPVTAGDTFYLQTSGIASFPLNKLFPCQG